MLYTKGMIKLDMLKVPLFFLTLWLSSCSTPTEDNLLWTASSYMAEKEGVHIHLSLNSLDGVEDILQANVMIQRPDGSGPLFAVENESVEIEGDELRFNWTDGFENKGSAELEIASEDAQTVRLKLEVDEVINERNMMFIDEYVLTKVPTGPKDLVTGSVIKEQSEAVGDESMSRETTSDAPNDESKTETSSTEPATSTTVKENE